MRVQTRYWPGTQTSVFILDEKEGNSKTKRTEQCWMEGTRAPSQNFSPVIGDYFSSCGGVGSLVYSRLALKLLSCMFKSETEALEGFTGTAVAQESSSSLPCGHFFIFFYFSVSALSRRHLNSHKPTVGLFRLS